MCSRLEQGLRQKRAATTVPYTHSSSSSLPACQTLQSPSKEPGNISRRKTQAPGEEQQQELQEQQQQQQQQRASSRMPQWRHALSERLRHSQSQSGLLRKGSGKRRSGELPEEEGVAARAADAGDADAQAERLREGLGRLGTMLRGSESCGGEQEESQAAAEGSTEAVEEGGEGEGKSKAEEQVGEAEVAVQEQGEVEEVEDGDKAQLQCASEDIANFQDGLILIGRQAHEGEDDSEYEEVKHRPSRPPHVVITANSSPDTVLTSLCSEDSSPTALPRLPHLPYQPESPVPAQKACGRSRVSLVALSLGSSSSSGSDSAGTSACTVAGTSAGTLDAAVAGKDPALPGIRDSLKTISSSGFLAQVTVSGPLSVARGVAAPIAAAGANRPTDLPGSCLSASSLPSLGSLPSFSRPLSQTSDAGAGGSSKTAEPPADDDTTSAAAVAAAAAATAAAVAAIAAIKKPLHVKVPSKRMAPGVGAGVGASVGAGPMAGVGSAGPCSPDHASLVQATTFASSAAHHGAHGHAAATAGAPGAGAGAAVAGSVTVVGMARSASRRRVSFPAHLPIEPAAPAVVSVVRSSVAPNRQRRESLPEADRDDRALSRNESLPVNGVISGGAVIGASGGESDTGAGDTAADGAAPPSGAEGDTIWVRGRRASLLLWADQISRMSRVMSGRFRSSASRRRLSCPGEDYEGPLAPADGAAETSSSGCAAVEAGEGEGAAAGSSFTTPGRTAKADACTPGGVAGESGGSITKFRHSHTGSLSSPLLLVRKPSIAARRVGERTSASGATFGGAGSGSNGGATPARLRRPSGRSWLLQTGTGAGGPTGGATVAGSGAWQEPAGLPSPSASTLPSVLRSGAPAAATAAPSALGRPAAGQAPRRSEPGETRGLLATFGMRPRPQAVTGSTPELPMLQAARTQRNVTE